MPDRGDDDSRRDLAAMVVPLGRALIAGEQRILDAQQLSMWSYVVLTALADEPARTQAALAAAIGADKTRIIAVLDDLQARRLIARGQDPADRRGHLLSLTPTGRRAFVRARAAIRGYERRLLDTVPVTERSAFLRALARLSAMSWPQLTGAATEESVR
jgi:DNA-binding MarR family transcriptional regulator